MQALSCCRLLQLDGNVKLSNGGWQGVQKELRHKTNCMELVKQDFKQCNAPLAHDAAAPVLYGLG